MSLSLQGWMLGSLSLLLLTITNPAHAWSYSLGTDYSRPFVQGDPAISMGASVGHNFSERWGVQLSQGAEKNFYIDASTNEWELADTVLAVNIYPFTLIPDVSWTFRLQAPLPISIASQANEIYSKPEARVYAAYPLSPEFRLTLDAFFRLTLSRYDSAPTENGVGGQPLPESAYGIGQSGIWQITPELSLSSRASYTEIKFHDVIYSGPGDPIIYDQPDQAYSLSAGLSWSFLPNNSLSASYSYGGILLQPGLDDYVLFDEEESRWSIGYAHSIP